MTQGRFFRPKAKDLLGTKYDSHLEKRFHDSHPTLSFHQDKFEYVIPHTYNPDFTVTKGTIKYLIECKGYFQDRAEMSKYNHIASSLPSNHSLIFLFENPDKPIHFQSKRKDGTKMTHREWCDKQGFKCFSEEEIGVWLSD